MPFFSGPICNTLPPEADGGIFYSYQFLTLVEIINSALFDDWY